VSVTDIRKRWTDVAKKVKKGRVLVIKGSKALYEIKPIEEEYIEIATPELSQIIKESKNQIKQSKQMGSTKSYAFDELSKILDTAAKPE
jgi:hypothetical protein